MTHLQSLVHGTLLYKVTSPELLFTAACDLIVLCHGSTVASEAVDCRVDVATDSLANALHVLSDEILEIIGMQKTYMTLGEYALQALSSLSACGAASGGSCCSVCGCWVVDPRGVGAGEVVCRHDRCVDVSLNVVSKAFMYQEWIHFIYLCSLFIHTYS
jgi:hypothetical protein